MMNIKDATSALQNAVTANRSKNPNLLARPNLLYEELHKLIIAALEDVKGEQIITIDLKGKSSFADAMVIASGTSQRHVSSLADSVTRALKNAGYTHVPCEGKDNSDWVLVDAGDIIVQIFRPETRERYNLEKMWSVVMPDEDSEQ